MNEVDFTAADHDEDEEWEPVCFTVKCTSCKEGLCTRHNPPFFYIDSCRGRTEYPQRQMEE